MKVIVTKSFKCAPEGHTNVTILAGEEVEGRVAEIAIELGCANKNVSKGKKLPSLETK
jgi:hypothetical protein